MPDEAEILAAGLRSWTVNHDAYLRAAVDLLIDQGHWLWDKGFTDACVRTSGDTTYISWCDADAYLQSCPPCSGGEAAILRIAIDLASDRWEITRLDGRNRGRVIEAVRRATDMDR